MTEGSKLPSGPEMAKEVLEEAGKPLHVKLIAERVIAKDGERPKAKRAYKGLTPAQTISAQLTVSHNGGATFERLAPGVFALRHWTATQKRKAPELPAGLKVRKPGSGGARQVKAEGDGLPPGSVVLREARPATEVEAERKVREAAKGGSKAASSAKASKGSKPRKTGGGSKGRKASAKSAAKTAASSTGSRRAQATKRVASSGRSR